MSYNNYIKFWDDFLSKWHRNHEDFIRNNPDGRAFFSINSRGKYINASLYNNIKCMPEPYYFGEDFINATSWADFKDAIVVLDLNPGMSHEADCLKTKDSPSHPILNNLAIGTYSTRINPNYSPFITRNPTIPGVTWWKSKRLAWFARFLSVNDVRKKMFAFELCPFHSKSWNVTLDRNSINFVKRNVLTPVASILTNNGKNRLGYCFGKDWEKIFTKELGFDELAKWGVDYDNPSKPLEVPTNSARDKETWEKNWPKNKNNTNTYINRIYKLYRGKIDGEGIHGKEIYFLCLRASGTFTAPGLAFDNVENWIKDDLKNLYNISL